MFRPAKSLVFGLVITACFSLIPFCFQGGDSWIGPGQVPPAQAAESERFFVGEKTCRECHHQTDGPDQFNAWYLSAHAKAYAALALPESGPIARLSGIDVDVYESPICLGCHTTASDAEDWERDPAFHLEDGIQCEFCHGPGSDYIQPDIMANPEAAMQAGLSMPDQTFCLYCHTEKGSHQAALDVKPWEFDQALAAMAHQGPSRIVPERPGSQVPPLDGPKYVGSLSCAACHNSTGQGEIYNHWRLSAHAEAYAVLGSQKARDIAGQMGVDTPPQETGECLGCHVTGQGEPEGRFEASFDAAYGVQCESCHGPGSEYSPEEVMADKVAAEKAGLWKPDAGVCETCHNGYHGNDFDYGKMWKKIEHRIPDPEVAAHSHVEYKTPFNLALNRAGTRLYVVCEGSDSLIVVDTEKEKVLAETRVENLPHGVCLSPGEDRIYVSNRGSDSVSVIDAASYQVLETIRVGDEPHDLMTDLKGETLYVANTGSNDLSVVDLKESREVKRLSGGRGPWGMSRSPDAKSIYVTNNLSHFVKFREPSLSEVTVIGTETARVDDRIMIPEANLVQGIDFAPSGEYALVTLLRTKNLLPITRVIQGWMITNGFGVLWKDGRVDQLLLDEFDHYFSDPTDLVITPDGRFAYVSGGGIDRVAVIDLERMQAVLARAGDEERRTFLPNYLGVVPEYVVKRIPVGIGPRGLAVSADSRRVYVADALDDTVSVIDVGRQERTAVISLGGPEEITMVRKGERVFHSANITYGRQFSCHSCHPDGGIDGLTYDIEADGLGVNPVDNRTLKGILDTAPFKWTGKNPSLSRQCGPRLAVFFTRIDPFTPEQVKVLDRYICTIPRNPNRYLLEGIMTPAQRRGKKIFERTMTNTGEVIPAQNRCVTCHPAPYFTNRQKFDVGTKSWLDTNGTFDVPHLNNIYETAPYLHDGQAVTLEEVWTLFNPEDKHGVTNDMTKDQLNDLIEYLKIL